MPSSPGYKRDYRQDRKTAIRRGETLGSESDNAKRKRKSKGIDWIVANDVSPANGKGTMGGDENTVHLITESRTEDWEPMTKQAVAHKLIEKMAVALAGKAEVARDD